MSKGLDFLVNSMAELDKIIKRKYVLLIAGDGEYYDAIGEQIKDLGLQDKVLQLGYRTDTENILYGSDAYVNSSKCYEALSFAILEAMSKYLPIVATNAGGNGDIVNEKTDCGFLIDLSHQADVGIPFLFTDYCHLCSLIAEPLLTALPGI